MSRVDEALRRAAEEATRAGEDTAALAREPFPIELGEHRKGQASAARPTLAVVGEEPLKPVERPGPAPKDTPGGLLGRVDPHVAEKLVTDRRIPPVSREQYRRLAAVLHASQEASGIKVVMVASAAEGEGKTLTAANLALTLSESYRRNVVLVDADLRRPALQALFGFPDSGGLSECLVSREEQQLKVWPVSPTLSVLPAGHPTGDPMAALTSERMRRVIGEARETFDWVIVDTPPVLLIPDAQLLGSMVDGVIVVIRADRTPQDLVRRAVDALGHAQILGTVLNGATTSPAGSSYEYYGRGPYYGSARGRHTGASRVP